MGPHEVGGQGGPDHGNAPSPGLGLLKEELGCGGDPGL